jgi:hypothetical protein
VLEVCWSSNSSITNSYATGSVSGTDYVGGLLGYNAGGTVTNSFYSDTTGQNDTGKGDLKNTEDMKKLTTFMVNPGPGTSTIQAAREKPGVSMKVIPTRFYAVS